MAKVVLHGYLADFHSGPIEVTGSTAAEIVEGLTRQLPGFQPHPIHGRHRIKVVGCEAREDLYRPIEGDEIHIIPQLNGAKAEGSMIQIALGAVLIGVGFALGPLTPWGSMAIKAGALSLLGGISQLLAPAPTADSQDKSRYLGVPKNTVQIGTRIPILYGRMRVYGHYLSFDINARDLSASASSTGSGASK